MINHPLKLMIFCIIFSLIVTDISGFRSYYWHCRRWCSLHCCHDPHCLYYMLVVSYFYFKVYLFICLFFLIFFTLQKEQYFLPRAL